VLPKILLPLAIASSSFSLPLFQHYLFLSPFVIDFPKKWSNCGEKTYHVPLILA
jgi:hypothetical protein